MALGCTWHSFRRLCACSVRLRVADYGPALGEPFLRMMLPAVNQRSGWVPTSNMFFDYSHDYMSYSKFHLLPVDGLINHYRGSYQNYLGYCPVAAPKPKGKGKSAGKGKKKRRIFLKLRLELSAVRNNRVRISHRDAHVFHSCPCVL